MFDNSGTTFPGNLSCPEPQGVCDGSGGDRDGGAASGIRLCPEDSRSLLGKAGQEFFASIDRPTTFYLVRHGQSEGNVRGIFQGRLDLSLDDTGRAQAARLGAWFAARGIDAAFCSPLLRAAETARIIASACALPAVIVDPVFSELDTGSWTGLGYEDAAKLDPESYRRFDALSWDAVPGAETGTELYARALRAWSRLAAEAAVLRPLSPNRERALLCVTHGGFLQWLLRATFGMRAWQPLFPADNCAVYELYLRPTALPDMSFMQWRRMNYQVQG